MTGLSHSGESDRHRRVTVGELRDWLAGFEPDTLILVDGYEDGYDRPHIHLAKVRPMPPERQRNWNGMWDHAYPSDEGETAIVVSRN